MADTTVETVVDDQLARQDGLWGPYWDGVSNGVIIYSDDGQDLFFTRTTDKGASWAETAIVAAGALRHIAVWYDKETPGNAGTLVHVVWLDRAATNVVKYRTVDVSDGSLGTERTVDNTVTISSTRELNRCCITVSRNGNIGIGFSTQTEVEFKRSTDSGASWDDRADVYETATEEDWCLLFPANTGDGDDMCAVFWDRDADAISVKMYDESGNSWTETAIASSMVDSPLFRNMDGSTRHSDGLVLLAAHNNFDNAADDLLTWALTVDSIASPTITAKATIFTNQDESAQVGMLINQQNDDVYVAHFNGSGWGSLVDCVYHLSTDDMGSWGSEQAYSEAAEDDLRIMGSGRTVGDDGGRWQPSFLNDDLTDIFVNEVNDVEIAAVAVGGRTMGSLAGLGGLAGHGGIAGRGGGIAA